MTGTNIIEMCAPGTIIVNTAPGKEAEVFMFNGVLPSYTFGRRANREMAFDNFGELSCKTYQIANSAQIEDYKRIISSWHNLQEDTAKHHMRNRVWTVKDHRKSISGFKDDDPVYVYLNGDRDENLSEDECLPFYIDFMEDNHHSVVNINPYEL